jgi:hypothetical protein
MNLETYHKLTLGFFGKKVINSQTTGRFHAFTVTTATSVTWSEQDGSEGLGDEVFTSKEIPAGVTVLGNIKSITPNGGEVIAYIYPPNA